MLPDWGIILAVAVLLMLIKVSGFFLAELPLSPRGRNFLRYTPYGALTALVVAGIAQPQANLSAELGAAALAIAAVRFTKQVWPGIVVGMAAFWLLAQLV